MKRESVVVRAARERERKTAERRAEREKRKISFVDKGDFDIKPRDVFSTIAVLDRGILDQRIDSKLYAAIMNEKEGR